jgi:hypothetical protein
MISVHFAGTKKKRVVIEVLRSGYADCIWSLAGDHGDFSYYPKNGYNEREPILFVYYHNRVRENWSSEYQIRFPLTFQLREYIIFTANDELIDVLLQLDRHHRSTTYHIIPFTGLLRDSGFEIFILRN